MVKKAFRTRGAPGHPKTAEEYARHNGHADPICKLTDRAIVW